MRSSSPNHWWMTLGCVCSPSPACLSPLLVDSPQIYRVGSRKVVGAGQKSGFYHAVDATTGALIDTLQVAPAGGHSAAARCRIAHSLVRNAVTRGCSIEAR